MVNRSRWVDGWDRLTLERYSEALTVPLESEDYGLHVSAVANGMTLREAYEMPIADSTEMASAYMGFITKSPKVRPMGKTVTVNGAVYVPTTDPGKITTAQYIDYDQLTDRSDLVEVLAIVMVPEGRKYNDGYDLGKVRDDMRKMTVEGAVSVCDFFARVLGLYGLRATRLARKALKETLREETDPLRRQELKAKRKELKETERRFVHLFIAGLTA